MCRASWIIALVIALTACFRPHYKQPFVEIPSSWRIEADEASTLCNLEWWKQFEDPVLNELIELALKNNQDLQLAISRVFEFYAKLGVTNAALYPEIDGNFIYNRTESSIAIPLPPPQSLRVSDDFQGFLSFSWEADFWGRIRSASEASYADFLSQIEARRGVVVTVVSSVANGYIFLRQLDAQLAISKKTMHSRTESLQLAIDRFELGETSQIEVKQAEAEVEAAAIRVIQFEREVHIQENLLSVLLGENPRCIERGIAIEKFHYPITIPAGLPSDLLIRRPDIARAENDLIAANARISEARALLYPQIQLTGYYGSESDELSEFLTNPAKIWQYGFDAVQSIFDAGKRIYLVWEAKARFEQALHSYKQTILNAFREVDDALIRYKKNKELVFEHQKQVEVLGDYLRLARLRYDEGEIDYLNVLDAERSLFDAELEQAAAQADSFAAIVDLYTALGGGWVDDSDSLVISEDLCE